MRFPIFVVLGTLLVAQPALQVAPGERLASELTRLREELPRSAPADLVKGVLPRLERAEAASKAGRVYQVLYDLEPAWATAKIGAFITASSDVTTAEAFEAKWKAIGEPSAAGPSDTRSLPLVVEAIAVAAQARGPATYRASRPYSVDSDLKAGLYYLGESQVLGQFAAFARSLPWSPAGRRPALRSLAPEIEALDREVTTAYERMQRSDHATYMNVSVTLKRARAVNDQQQWSAALLEYLFARLRFAPLRGAAPPPVTAERLAELRSRVAGAADHSIAQLFLDLAEAWSTGADETLRRTAAFVPEDVLPAYFAALEAPASTTSAAATAPVTVTLVRWPYT